MMFAHAAAMMRPRTIPATTRIVSTRPDTRIPTASLRVACVCRLQAFAASRRTRHDREDTGSGENEHDCGDRRVFAPERRRAKHGHAVVTQEANRKQYALTAGGLAELEAKRGEADALFEGLARVGSRMARVREAYAGLDGADSATASALHRARHALDHALADKRGCEPDEARRIVRIIDAAVAEILAKREP